jgi:hypothetical protein
MTNVPASRNLEEGVDFEEDDDFAGGGDLVATLVGVTADENEGGDAGLKIREKGAGSLDATVSGAQANGNDGDGVNVREDAGGSLAASIDRAMAKENGGDGIGSRRTRPGISRLPSTGRPRIRTTRTGSSSTTTATAD